MRKMTLILAVLALLCAACKSSTTTEVVADDGANSSSSASQTEPAATGVDAPSEAPTSPPGPTVDTSSSAAQVGADDWCGVAAAVEDNFDQIDIVAVTDPAALEEAYRNAGALIAQAQSVAPPIIAADVAKTVEGVVLLTDMLEAAEWNFLNLDPSAMEPIGNELDVAGYNIQKYNFDVCNIGEDPGEPPVFDDSPLDDGVPPSTGTIGEQAIASLMQSGFTEAEAQCLITQMDFANPESFADTAGLLAVFTECGIPLDRLSQLGG